MAFEKVQEKAVSKKLISSFETICKTRENLAQDELISSTIESFGYCQIVAEEKNQDKLNMTGKVYYTIVYENKAKSISSFSGTIDFSDKTQVGNAEWVYSVSKVKNVKTIVESETVIEVVATIEICVYGIVKNEISYVKTDSDAIEIKSNKTFIQELACASSDTFSLSDSFEIGECINKLIAVYPTTFVKSVVAQDNYAVVNGELSREFICMSCDNIKRYTKSIEFSEEISLLGAKKDMKLDLDLILLNSENAISILEDQNKTVINSVYNYKASAFGFNNKEIYPIEDMFSTENKLMLNAVCDEFTTFDSQELYVSSVSASLDLSAYTRMDEVISVTNIKTNVISAIVENDELKASIMLNADIIYKNYELDLIATKTEKFNFDICQKSQGSIVIDLVTSAKCDSFKNKPGKELAVNFDLNIISCLGTNRTISYITDVTETNYETDYNEMLTIYMPSTEESLFDVAKNLRVKTEHLKAQNNFKEDGSLPEKIVLYREN